MSTATTKKPLPGSTEIAWNKTVAQWHKLCADLESAPTTALWEEAYKDFFLSRLDHRYFKPIAALEKEAPREGEGFSIVAIQCSLIEFLETTYLGEIYKYRQPDKNAHEYKDSKEKFMSFLKNHEPFKTDFADTARDWPKEFYEGVRCGLLHEAGTRGGWRIHYDRPAPGIFDKGTKILYRKKLQDALDAYLKAYRAELLIGADSANTDRQKAFIRKMNSLCHE